MSLFKFCKMLLRDMSRPFVNFIYVFVHQLLRKLHSFSRKVVSVSKMTLKKHPVVTISDIAGLISNGESWLAARRQVQQDMMKPKSALFYVDQLNAVTQELCVKIAENLGWKFMSCCSHGQELGQQASWLLIG